MKETLHFLKKEFPGKSEGFFLLLLNGISHLSNSHISEFSKGPLDQLLVIQSNSWNDYFKTFEDYLKELLRVWPEVIFLKIQKDLSGKKTFNGCLNVYRKSHFGFFLSNLKMASSIYNSLHQEWNICYDIWISGNVRIILPVSGSNENSLKQCLRQITNEVILQPDKYHFNNQTFRTMIKRQYQLLLTEQDNLDHE